MAPRGLLLDLEGVLYEEGRPLAGAVEAVQALRAAGLSVRYLTNTTTKARGRIAQDLLQMGFPCAPDDVFSPAAAAARLLAGQGVTRLHLAASADLADDFAGFVLTDAAPQAVVLGDLYEGFTWRRLNQVFAMLDAGATLIALHRNRVCRRDGAIALDLGPFVAALEYAARVEAVVVGKPSPAFFRLALEAMGVAATEAVMVGDDLEADIGGAQAGGLTGILVRTGKFTPRDLAHPEVRPDAVLGSIAELPAHLAGQGAAEER